MVIESTIEEMEAMIEGLAKTKTGNLFADCVIEDEIALLQDAILHKQGKVPQRPSNSEFECFGCGS